ncbi:MAG: TolC family protein, partial [Gemmatimonadota bacterium]
TVTLEEALQRALALSPTLAAGEAQLLGAEESRRTAVGSFLPTLSASSGASLSSATRYDPVTQQNVTGSSEGYNAGLSVGYEIFNGGRNRAELNRAGADMGAADANLENQRFAVTLQTKRLFFQALRQADLLAVSRARVHTAEEGLELVRRRVQVGTGTRSDSLRARLELSNARQVALQAETATRAARYALARQIGLPSPVTPVLPEDLSPSPLPMSEEEMFRVAEEQSPGVRAARASTAAAGAAVTVARAAFFPTLRASSGYSWSNSQFGFDQGRTSWNAGLSLSYPIFNGFGRSANAQRAGNQQRVARLQEDDALLAAREQVDGALFGLRTAELAIELAEEALGVAEEDFRVVRERYEHSVATILDVITSQVAYDQAQVNLVTARYDYVVARAELGAILGRDL